MKFNYGQEFLDSLWDLIKGETWGWSENYTGLIEVDFKVPLAYFRKAYERKFGGERIPLVFTNIEKAIEELSDAVVDVHHFSCASFTNYGTNPAICVHYKKPDGKRYALAIPGIIYLPL